MPETTDADVEAAVREAELAQAHFLTLEHAALHWPRDKRPDGSEVAAQQREAELAAGRVEITRRRAEETRAAKRLADLSELGADIEHLAADAAGPALEALAGHLAAVAEASAAVRAACSDHDARVADLSSRAADLGTEPAGQHGPRASSGYVVRQQQGGSVQHRGCQVSKITPDITRRAIAKAAEGDTDAALALVSVVRHVSNRAAHYYRFTDTGEVLPGNESAPTRQPYAGLLLEGRITELDDAEIAAYLGEGS